MGEAGLHLGAQRRLDDQLAAAGMIQLDAAGRAAAASAAPTARWTPRPRIWDRPGSGWPMAFMWARSWWVRPVKGRSAIQAGPVRRPADGGEGGLRRLGPVLLGVGRAHHLEVVDAGLLQRQIDLPGPGLGRAHDDGPVGLLRLTPGEGPRQPLGRLRALAQQQHARRCPGPAGAPAAAAPAPRPRPTAAGPRAWWSWCRPAPPARRACSGRCTMSSSNSTSERA